MKCYGQEVDPCEDLTDDDIRTAIQNATGPKSALFVPEVGYVIFFFHFYIAHNYCLTVYSFKSRLRTHHFIHIFKLFLL